MWDGQEIIATAAGALRGREAALREEQAFAGLDALEEVSLHPVLARGFEVAGWGVVREQGYPGRWRGRRGRRRVLPEDPERDRCDLVLLPRAGQRLADPLRTARAVEADRAAREGTLFAGTDLAQPGGDGGAVAPADAYWLEVKVVGQHAYVAGVPGPNGAYASQLLRGPVGDLKKLAGDGEIVRGGVLVVLFAADEATARHDLGVLGHRCLDRGVAMRSPLVEGFAIVDRVGNGWCALWLAERAVTGGGAEVPGPGDEVG